MKRYLLGMLLLLGNMAVADYKAVGNVARKYVKWRQKEGLFSSVGCRYMNGMMVDSAIAWKLDAKKSPYYTANKAYYDSLVQRYAQDVEQKVLAPMYIQYVSDVVGYGVKALKPIEKDDFIGIYAGELRPMRHVDHAIPENVVYAWYYLDDAPNGQRMIVDGEYMGNELRFINHDEKPNTGRVDVIVHNRWYICYVALRDIAKDEELTISYGTDYWLSRGISPELIKK